MRGTLEAMVYGLPVQYAGNKDVMFCPMIDARRMEVYTVLYDSRLQELSPAEARANPSRCWHQKEIWL